MRFAARDTQLLYNNNHEFVGVNLGWDFVAEHEFGIEDINRSFKIDYDNEILYGIDKRCINYCPSSLYYGTINHNNEKYFVLSYTEFPFNDKDTNKDGSLKSSIWSYFNFYDWFFDKQDTIASWDGRSFAICTKKENKENLFDLYNAIKEKNAIIFFAYNDNPFGNDGLCIVIKDKLDKEMMNELKEKDVLVEKLQKAFDKTNIKEILKNSKKEYYSLTPMFDEDGTLVFYLNPRNQDLYSSGWFSLKDLKDWANDKGVVLRNKKYD